MKPSKLSSKGAVWAGILGTPVLLVALLVTIGVSGAASKGGTSSSAASTQSTGKLIRSQPMNAAATYRYWTPARMAAAKPVPVPAIAESQHGVAAAGGPSGPARAVSGYVPANLRALPASPQSPQGSGGARPDVECYHCFVPYTQYYYFARYRTYPVSTVAKMFFTNNGGNYVCSASVQYTNVVWTAGHCVANTDFTHQFSTNVLICPSYNAGVNPAVGCWAGGGMVTWTNWFSNNSFEWDMGGITMSNCGTVNCTDIGNVTGYLGLAWNWPENQNYYAFGYPQGSPFDGRFIVTTNSQFGYEDSDGNNQGGPNSVAIGSSQTGGSSGGPWVWQFGTNNYLNGHNDWRHTAVPEEMNSPYFDTRACQIANAAGRPLTC